jgi:hypothetical protein
MKYRILFVVTTAALAAVTAAAAPAADVGESGWRPLYY